MAFTLRSTSLAGEFFSRSLTRDCRSLKTSLGCFMRFPFLAQKLCIISCIRAHDARMTGNGAPAARFPGMAPAWVNGPVSRDVRAL
ncbi:hypothetical protein FU139_15200 [Burkholderia territorii]|nr:hypothetical protein FU139_15200 [Burkholderia territorii]